MPPESKIRVAVQAVLVVFPNAGAWARIAVQEDVFHIVKSVVKSIDKDSKTMVVKTADRAEHTIKWADKTMEGGKDLGKAIGEGGKVSVKHTEKAGEKTAVGVRGLGKRAAKEVSS